MKQSSLEALWPGPSFFEVVAEPDATGLGCRMASVAADPGVSLKGLHSNRVSNLKCSKCVTHIPISEPDRLVLLDVFCKAGSDEFSLN